MAENTITKSGALFSPELITQVFSKVKGHSALAALSGQNPIPFSGNDVFVFTMDGEASIVGEGDEKPAGEALFTKKTIKPIKFVYQHRLTDEFMNLSEQQQLPYMEQFTDGFAKKMARALDIAAFHGLNPKTATASDIVGTNCFSKEVTNSVTLSTGKEDEALDDAVALIQANDGDVNGIVLTPQYASAMGKIKADGTGTYLYPEFRFGARPTSFAGRTTNVNNTLSFNNSKNGAIIGDFEKAFRWGYAENIPMEVIQYGDPDGLGDLKRNNQIVLRAEAYLGWGILDADSFAKVVSE